MLNPGRIEVVSLKDAQRTFFVKVRPYMVKNVKNPRQAKKRSSVWIEAGFEANNTISVAVALRITEQLATACEYNCKFDYYIVPVYNTGGYTLARKWFPEWVNTYKESSASTYETRMCSGYNLLNSFKNQLWRQWHSLKYIMPVKDTYCSGLKDRRADVINSYDSQMKKVSDNIGLNFVLSGFTETRATISSPSVAKGEHKEFPTNVNKAYGNYRDSTQAFIDGANTYFGAISYTTWVVANKTFVNGDITAQNRHLLPYIGHPTDYYDEEYNVASYNIAFVDQKTTEEYIDEYFNEVLMGINSVTGYWKKSPQMKVLYYN